MPRSPSTVRLTGTVATTSRARPASSGSISTTECTSVVAPPTSTTTTSPAPGCASSRPRASSSTAVSTTSGVAPRTMAVKSPRFDRCLPPITCRRNISRIAARAEPGASTPICGTTLSARTCGVPASSSRAATCSRASTLPATTTGPRQRASAVTSASLPTTAIRRPPPADEQASTSASAARGSTRVSSARQASQPSRTSVSTVVRWPALASSSPVPVSTSAALVKVDPKSTQATGRWPRPRGSSTSAGGGVQGPVQVRDQVVGGLDAHREPDQVGGHLQVGAGHRGVRHPARVLDERLDPAERLREREHLRLRAGVQRGLLPSGDPERHDAAVPLHLLRGDRVPGVLGQPGVDHLGDGRVLGEEVDDLLRVVAVPVHPDREGLQAAQREPGVERPGDGADG